MNTRTIWTRLRAGDLRHLGWLLFWPLFGLLFTYLENGRSPVVYYPMRCALDSLIPFCKWFVIPYAFWFLYEAGMLAYTALRDAPAFRRMMRFIVLTYGFALLVYAIFPNCQHLRPTLPLDGSWASRLVSAIYASDTSTNVCPSIHVLGSFAVYFAARDTKRFSTPVWKAVFGSTTLLISLSTVFLKQHSVLDVCAALAVCAVAYPLVYRAPVRRSALRPTAALVRE